jgi:hypothetical protein
MLKTLLVHIPSERLIRPVVDGAVSLAVTCGAHLDAVSIGYEIANVGLAVDDGAAVAAVFEIERERALARANAALGRSVAHSHCAKPEAARQAALPRPATSGSGLLNTNKQHGNRQYRPSRRTAIAQKPTSAPRQT